MSFYLYRRREAEKTPLYQVVHKHLPAFLQRGETSGHRLPGFVRNELEAFLRCGILSHGFARFECKRCRHNHVVAFSCKGRGFCPSCGGRRMTGRAAHLVDAVLPNVPVRQWVLTLPVRLRYLIAYDAKLCSEILNAFISEIFRWHRRSAKRHAGLESMAQARCGSLTFIQRAGSALNLNVHFHSLVLDGIYVHRAWNAPLRFVALPSPANADIEATLCRVKKRIIKILARHGHASPDDEPFNDFAECEPLLAACVTDSLTHQNALQGEKKPEQILDAPPAPLCASEDYYSLHANTRIRSGERKRLEKLCRYVARPPVSNALVVELGDGSIAYKLKRPWQDGTTALVFKPFELLARLASLVPPPRVHQVRYHGVLASASALREFVVPAGPRQKQTRTRKNYCWAELMQRAFEIDVLQCPRCAGTMRFVASIMQRDAIVAILGSMGLPADSPTSVPASDFGFVEDSKWQAA